MEYVELRQRLIGEARRLSRLGVGFTASGAGAAMFVLPCEDPPSKLSCSQFVRYVFERTLPDVDWQGRLIIDPECAARDGSACDLFKGLQETTEPKPGDLTFYTRPGNVEDEWHVMMVSDPTSYVIGSCPILGGIGERDAGEYVALSDDSGHSWTFRGSRRMPFEASDVPFDLRRFLDDGDQPASG